MCGVPNGCGPASGPRSDNLFYNPSCSTHDKCYAIIGKTQEQCDVAFLKDMYAQCGGMMGPCADGARFMYGLPSVLGRSAYVTAQQCAGKVDLENTESDLNAIAKMAPDQARSASSATIREIGLEMAHTRIRIRNDAADVKAAAARVAQLQAQYIPASSGPATISSLTSSNAIGAQLNAVAAKLTPILDDTNAKIAKREPQLTTYVETTSAAAGEAAVATRSGEVIQTVNEARALNSKARTPPSRRSPRWGPSISRSRR